MSRVLLLIFGFIVFVPLLIAADIADEQAGEKVEEKSWWQKRHERPDIFYPHNVHMEVMEKEGDPCLLCHAFSKTEVIQPEQIESLTRIANEPLEAICHNCHLDRHTAPSRCELCHTDVTAVTPPSHDFDYVANHAEDARLDNNSCRTCHVDASFCTDCHFRRDRSQRHVHKLGYRSMHGIDARMNTFSCGRCHNASYCADCHRGSR